MPEVMFKHLWNCIYHQLGTISTTTAVKRYNSNTVVVLELCYGDTTEAPQVCGPKKPKQGGWWEAIGVVLNGCGGTTVNPPGCVSLV